MTTKNSKLRGGVTLPGIITLFFALMLFFSCKKDSVETVSVKNNMAEAAKILEGTILAGNITSESDENQFALNYNTGNKFILVGKIPGSYYTRISDIQSAEVITSKYGVILKDLSNNKIFLMANNDSESLKIFEKVSSLFNENLQSEKVFGVTIVNAEKL